MPLPGAFLGQFRAFVNSYFCRAFAHALQSVGNFFASLIGFGILSSLLPVGCTLYFSSTFFFASQPQLAHGLFRYLRCRPLARGSVF